MQENKTNWLAICSLILSILSILCCCIWGVSLVIASAAIITGVVGLRSDNPNQKDAAIAGIVVGGVGLVQALAIAVFRILLYANMAGESLGAIDQFRALI